MPTRRSGDRFLTLAEYEAAHSGLKEYMSERFDRIGDQITSLAAISKMELEKHIIEDNASHEENSAQIRSIEDRLMKTEGKVDSAWTAWKVAGAIGTAVGIAIEWIGRHFFPALIK